MAFNDHTGGPVVSSAIAIIRSGPADTCFILPRLSNEKLVSSGIMEGEKLLQTL
jgi:hypothetical protein